MCTTIAVSSDRFYFCRNMDIECDFGQQVVLVPRHAPLAFRREDPLPSHPAILGMARLQDGYPLYADAMNEHGLCMAGLNFPGFAHYPDGRSWKPYTITPYEMIPWVLGQCRTLSEARALLERTELAAIPFHEELSLTPLHWHIADKTGSLAVEPLRDGLHISDDPAGVLTNSPPLDAQLAHLGQYLCLTPDEPDAGFDGMFPPLSKGLGNIGLPGDVSSMSRFVRTAILRKQAVFHGDADYDIAQCFHLLDAVSVINGTIRLPDDGEYCTIYRCCMEPSAMRYHYCCYTDACHRTVQADAAACGGCDIQAFQPVP